MDTCVKPWTDVTWLPVMRFDFRAPCQAPRAVDSPRCRNGNETFALRAVWMRLWEMKQQNGRGRKKSETGKDVQLSHAGKRDERVG